MSSEPSSLLSSPFLTLKAGEEAPEGVWEEAGGDP